MISSGKQRGAQLELKDVVMAYGDRVVTEPISIEVPAGKTLSIIGPSGCGKTTLLRSIAHLTTPMSGGVFLDGELVTDVPNDVAVVFQQFGLFPWKTVEANIAYGLRAAGETVKAAKEGAQAFINMVGLEGFEQSYPHELSGGMQQRTGLARALAMRPRILLMDEPFGALDAQTREVLQYEVMELLKEYPATVVFVTHSIDEAVLFGDTVIILKDRPSRILEQIDIDLPSDRNRLITSTPEFFLYREKIWDLVMRGE